jgi:hypothetical protein
VEKRKIACPLPGIEPRFFGHPALSLVAIASGILGNRGTMRKEIRCGKNKGKKSGRERKKESNGGKGSLFC